MTQVQGDGIQTHVHFLAKDKLFDVEKPYSLRFPPFEGLPQSNIKREKHPLTIQNMRRLPCNPSLEVNGFEVMPLNSRMSYKDFDDEGQIQSTYLNEVRRSLMMLLKAKHVHVMDFAVRRRASSFPISTGEEFEAEQPAAMAHIDFSVRDGERLLNVMYGDQAEKVLKDHWQIVNVWKPLRGPLNDWPLGLCDARSVDFRKDIMAGDLVYEDFAVENLQVLHNPKQRWYYLPDQEVSEALIFKSADSAHCDAPACPHASFYNPAVSSTEPPRESIDCRAFVLYADLAEYPPIVDNIFEWHL